MQDSGAPESERGRRADTASQRLADQITLVILYHMLQESAIQLQREMLQMLQDKENEEQRQRILTLGAREPLYRAA
ncbi:hypothetical protein SKAU_G00239880 [Synaphobranchus kaupii]|uniref:Dynamin GTPase effector domain-containing protein n=1 Tax=Synaphobranchus kaupii TaxID=118154 RepID=A0A9Q1ITS4_SYNKA|nr:hypothetical protein SKAU_G00239860 [Synaphobranchus kaupii]KAJ8352512.1 hypothetical protein SKAU_G00239880 [Synaphobranchus kaupii]